MLGFNRKKGGRSDCWLPGIFKQHELNNKKGFTLLEIMAVLVIMGTVVSVSVKKFEVLSDTASLTALKVGVREINTREALVWTQIKLSDDGWSNDDEVFDAIDKNTGRGYSWNPVPDVSGGTLHYKSQSADLDRKASTDRSAGSWK